MKLTADEFVKKRTKAYMAAFAGEKVIIENTRYPDVIFILTAQNEADSKKAQEVEIYHERPGPYSIADVNAGRYMMTSNMTMKTPTSVDLQVRSQLMLIIRDMMYKKGWTQKETAEVLDFSVGMLFGYLSKLGWDVEFNYTDSLLTCDIRKK
jgi:hypothetical protein